MRELTFEKMVDRGLNDVRAGRIISNDEMQAGSGYDKNKMVTRSRALIDTCLNGEKSGRSDVLGLQSLRLWSLYPREY